MTLPKRIAAARPAPCTAPCVAMLLALCACQNPPNKSVDHIAPPKLDRDPEQDAQFLRKAHANALSEALPLVLAAQKAAEPLATYQAGFGPAAIPALTLGERTQLAELVDAAELALGEIDEVHLEPSSVVILRVVRFSITALNDELERRPEFRQDPTAPMRVVTEVLDELEYRLVQDDCDASCEALASELASALPASRSQLAAASPAATRRAEMLAAQLARRSSELGERPLLDRHAKLRDGLGELATALDDHAGWLAALSEALPNAKATHVWTAKPAPIHPGGVGEIERLPDVLGRQALSRRLVVEERIILNPESDVARVAGHVHRWKALRRELVGDPVPTEAPAPVDVARCEAALARIDAGLAKVEAVEPAKLDCERYVALLGDRQRNEAALVLELLDYGVIEPQRRALRGAELPEIALVTGQWSTKVHTHLRRVMLLAQIAEPAALELAIDQGTEALCLAEAALWVHTELGLPTAARDAVGAKCAVLDDGEPLLDSILGDPRGALTGFGLSLIGDEPARMVGFDRFFWAPLGLMQTLATPQGMHPDQFTLPSETRAPDPEINVKIETLSPGDPR